MLFQNEGISLWYDTEDAPAPGDLVHENTPITITVGVKPIDASNRVEILYRRNAGIIDRVHAKWLRNDHSNKTQYFRASLPAFKAGDRIEYHAICSCAGRIVPSPETARQLVSSFRIVGSITRSNQNIPLATTKSREIAMTNQPAPSPNLTGTPDNKFIVQGQVRYSDGVPLVDAIVIAANKTLSGEDPIASSTTNQEGHYDISFMMQQISYIEKDGVRIIIRALASDGKVLADSILFIDKPKVSNVDLVVSGAHSIGISEYDILSAQVTPLLKSVLSKEQFIGDNDQYIITSLVKGTGRDPQRILFFVMAYNLGQTTGIPLVVFYGLFRQGLPNNLSGWDTVVPGKTMNINIVSKRVFEALLNLSSDVHRNALEKSIHQNIIPSLTPINIDSVINQLKQQRIEIALQKPNVTGKTSIGELLNTSIPSKELQRNFMTHYLDQRGSARKFWSDLQKQSGFSAEQVNDIKFTLDVGRITNNYVPLVRKIRQMQSEGKIQSIRDLAKLNANDWEVIIKGSADNPPIGVPANIPGKDDKEKTANYALILALRFETRFPTVALSSRLENDTDFPIISTKEDIVQFFSNNPKFELDRTNIDKYLTDKNETALVGIGQPEEIKSQLKIMQRIFKLSHDYSVIKLILSDGIHSSYQIYSMGKDNFVAKYKMTSIGKVGAEKIFNRAERTYGLILALVARENSALKIGTPLSLSAQNVFSKNNQQLLRNYPNIQTLLGYPNIQTLFGSLDFCDCKDCRSVYSPAAYLVDILNFLNKRKSNISNKSVNEVLFERRPDLGQIELSCENTNVVLPYIDLVNEILEYAVSPSTAPPYDLRQTTGTPDEVAANPEYINNGAYGIDKLAGEAYPWNLPFDLNYEESEIYFDHLNIKRYEIMRTFQKEPSPTDQNARNIAIEYLRLTPIERKIITGAAYERPQKSWNFWGLEQDNNSILDPGDENISISGSWIDVLKHTRIFLLKSGLTFQDFLVLINLKFINPDGQIKVFSGNSYGCDLSKIIIENLTEETLNRIHRFVRLWRKLGWTMEELDKVITVLQGKTNDINLRLCDKFLLDVSHVLWLNKELKIPIISILSLWSNIDTIGINITLDQKNRMDTSLYNSLFQNKTILNPVDEVFKLNSNSTDLLAFDQGIEPKPKMSEHIPTILAALGISESDLSFIMIHEVADGYLNLANITKVYRTVLLSKAIGLSIRDFLTIKELLSDEYYPFDSEHIEKTIKFVEKVRKVYASKFKINELDFLLRHNFRESSGIAPTDQSMGILLYEMRGSLNKISTENELVNDPTGEITKKKLAILLEGIYLDDAMAIIDGTSNKSRIVQIKFIQDHFGKFLDPTDAIVKLVDGTLSKKEDRIKYVLKPLLKYLKRTMSENYIKQKLSEDLKLDTAMIEGLLTDWLKSPFNPSEKIMTEFLELPSKPRSSDDLTPISTSEVIFEPLFKILILLYKITLVVRKLKIRPEEMKWIFNHGVEAGWLNLNKLPIAQTSDINLLFSSWERLVDVFRLRDLFPISKITLFDLFSLANNTLTDKATFLNKLSELTEWKLENLEVLCGKVDEATDTGLLELVFPDDYKNETALFRLQPCFELIKRLGVSAFQIKNLIKPYLSTADILDLKNTVKSKYDNKQWLSIAKPMRDILREKQRSALTSYVIANPIMGQNWHDNNDLTNYFLIDVEMSPCQMTSRIRQAISSVQQFVQRCIMNLEKDVIVDAKADSRWKEWKWMKNYRVWEANRKIFLYPENWIEPELRDGKSTLFKELENELLQNELTAETAETAFLNYLEKLDKVARLEISGMYHQYEDDGTEIIHIFGRTHGQPHIYYYCRRVNPGYYTPWEKVDLDISEEQLIPVVWNRRLYLFWPIFTEKSKSPPSFNKIPNPGDEFESDTDKLKYWEIQLASSEYKNGKWNPKKVSSQKWIDIRHSPKHSYSFKAFATPHVLRIDIFRPEEGNSGEFAIFGPNGDMLVYRNPNYLAPLDESIYGKGAREIRELDASHIKSKILVPINTSYENQYLVAKDTGDNTLNVLIKNKNRLDNGLLLNQVSNPYSLLVPHQDAQFDFTTAFFYQDSKRVYYISPSILFRSGYTYVPDQPANIYNVNYIVNYRFETFYHPFVTLLVRELYRSGISGILNRTIQTDPQTYVEEPFDFNLEYSPNLQLVKKLPVEEIDFSYAGAYSIYNWELFFHIPFLIATRLSKNQKFEEALNWFHYIFDPTKTGIESSPQRYWITKPFYKTTSTDYHRQRIQEIMHMIAKRDKELENQVEEWKSHPFNPHLIARHRTVAYQKNIVMKYIDTIIAWGDQLFRRDTLESVNEAMNLYILAAQLLGPTPILIPEQKPKDTKTFNQIKDELDAFSNTFAEIENLMPQQSSQAGREAEASLPQIDLLYFSIPPNDKLLNYWDIVADRLFKIRHCMNIEGVERQLPLFEPPIEPGLLVRATAAGLDISSALNEINAPLPHYRFNTMLQKTYEVCNDVNQLGSALLSALEKRDAEALSLLRSEQEIKLLDAMRQVKEKQIEETKQTHESLNNSKKVIEIRRDYYRDIQKISDYERLHMDNLSTAHTFNQIAQGINVASSLAFLFPHFKVGAHGFGGTPAVDLEFGGRNLGSSLRAISEATQMIATQYSHQAMMASIKGGYERRWDDWKLQEKLANKEIEQIDRQILASEIRLAITEKELENHNLQMDNAKSIDDYMKSKFTNQELYDWMISQISTIYFQSYQLAYDLAKRAERAYKYELGSMDSTFIQFGYWDSLKKGLLAGEKLKYDLKRMEVAYLDQNRREYEITKHVSLAALDPLALLKLKENGECFVDIPEELFDMDTPGHYMRRIKNVSLTIPCIIGPYMSVNCKLTLVRSSTRLNTSLNPNYGRNIDAEDPRFKDNFVTLDSIVTSSAQNDSGLFDINFNDERYLPFEGQGAISGWRLEIIGLKQFDLSSISDAIIHIRYTAREGGDSFRKAAKDNLTNQINSFVLSEGKKGLFRSFSARHEFPTEWHKFFNSPMDSTKDQFMNFNLSKNHFPFFTKDVKVTAKSVDIVAKINEDVPYIAVLSPPLPDNDNNRIQLTKDSQFGDLHHGHKKLGDADIGSWILKIMKQGNMDFRSLKADEIEEIILIVQYEVELSTDI